MIYNNSITIYHKENDLDTLTHLEKWKRYNYEYRKNEFKQKYFKNALLHNYKLYTRRD